MREVIDISKHATGVLEYSRGIRFVIKGYTVGFLAEKLDRC